MPSTGELDRLRAGVVLDGRRTRPARITILPGKVRNCQLLVVIGEGRNNQIRRMFELIMHPVVKLTREAIGTVKARGITPGEFRRLTSPELKALRRPGGPEERPGAKKRRRPDNPKQKSLRRSGSPAEKPGAKERRRPPAERRKPKRG